MRINWCSYTFLDVDGYGRHGSRMVRALHKAGVDIQPVPYDALEWEGWLQRLAGIDFSRLTVSLMSAGEMIPLAGRQWGFSMFESTAIPPGWADTINQVCERLIVPCAWIEDVFRKNGVRKSLPIHIIGEGVDPYEFPYFDRRRKPNDPFTFLVLGDRGGRKGEAIAWTAFHQAFPDPLKENVRLVVKCRSTSGLYAIGEQKWLSVWREDVTRMADVYAQADCFVFPSHAEGWGLPPREAASTGLPVIATRYSGMAGDIDHWGIPLEDVREIPSLLFPERGGMWAQPSVDEVAEKMRWVYDHQTEAFANAKKASDWLHANQTWDHAAADFVKLLEEWG